MKRDEPIRLTLGEGNRQVTVCGDLPQPAINAPLTRETVERNLTKLGGTVYTVGSFFAEMEEGLMLPISRLNDLRRRALGALAETESRGEDVVSYTPVRPKGGRKPLREARFYTAEQITPRAKDYFNVIYLPLHRHVAGIAGVVMPPVIFDGDLPAVEAQLKTAVRNGAKYALVGNLGHLDAVRRHGLIPVGDFRLNVTNGETVARLESLGVERVILSPELTLPQIRDLKGNTSVILYGRIPLMTLEKCVIKELADCNACHGGKVSLLDRRGAKFPVLREWEHRNVVYNSLPTCMSDRQAALRQAGVTASHMIFTTESPREVDRVIGAFEKGEALGGQVRRLT
jgi:putative protease